MSNQKTAIDECLCSQRRLILEGLLMVAVMAGLAIGAVTVAVGLVSSPCLSCHSAMKL
jgi:hypothetical protein